MPPRSSGCFTCRKRKIRCDEGRPGCGRCATHGVVCPGYRKDIVGGIVFEDQTVLTVRRAHESYRTKPTTEGRKPSSTSPASLALAALSIPSVSTWSTVDTENGEIESATILSTWLSQHASPRTLASVSSNRMALYDNFLRLYLPDQIGSSFTHFSFMLKLAEKPSASPPLAHAMDALSSVQIGSSYRDPTLLRQSIVSYGKALISLARGLSTPGSETNDDLLAAATVMSICEFFDGIQQGGTGWVGHVQGVQRILTARGHKSLQSELSLLLLCNARHGSFVRALIMRKADAFAAPKWLTAFSRNPLQDETTEFYNIASHTPALLERFDRLVVSNSGALEAVDELIADGEAIESKLRIWLADRATLAKMSGEALPATVDIESFTTFPTLVMDRTLLEAFIFPNFIAGYLSSQYWSCMYYLRICLRHLYTLRSVLRPDMYDIPYQEVTEEELWEYVMNLCKCIPFFIEPESASTGHVSVFLPLRLVAVHFRSTSNWEWLRWAGNVRDNIFQKGLKQPGVGDRLPPGTLASRAISPINEGLSTPGAFMTSLAGSQSPLFALDGGVQS